MRYILLSFISIFCLHSVQAQQVVTARDKSYLLSGHDGFDVNLPQLDLVLHLPPKVSFCPPYMFASNVSIDLGDQTYYYWDKDRFTNGESSDFTFARNQDRETPLYLTVKEVDADLKQALDAGDRDEIMRRFKKEKMLYNEFFIPSLKTDVGESFSYQSNYSGVMGNDTIWEYEVVHTFYHMGYELEFFYEAMGDDERERIYLDLIKSIRKKDFKKEREEYNLRAKHGFYNIEKHFKVDIDEYIGGKFHEQDGDLEVATRFSYPDAGISLEIPEGTFYQIKGRYIEDVDPTLKEIRVNPIDFENQNDIPATFRHDDIFFETRLYNNQIKKKNLEDRVKELKEIYTNHFYTTTTIGKEQIVAQVYLFGTKVAGRLFLYFSIDDYTYLIEVFNYSIQNKDQVDRLFNSFRIADIGTFDAPLSQSIYFQKLDIDSFDVLSVGKPNLNLTTKIEFKDLKASMHIPNTMSDYYAVVDREVVEVPQDGVFENILPEGRGYYQLFDKEKGLDFSIRIVKANDAVDLAVELALGRELMNSMDGSRSLKASFVTLNNIKWAIHCTDTSGYHIAMASAIIDGYMLTVYIKLTDELNNLEQDIALLRTFSLK